ncbi:hypothetical protein COCOBI_03-7110 [Coccomyxa sp. Obi]|nr:hypothetical protein COCOBI_03-7110 [Coccomyxa sp. Obi]
MQPDPCGYDKISLAKAREISRQIHEGLLTAEDNEATRREEFSAFPRGARAAATRGDEDDDMAENVSQDPRVHFGSVPPFRKRYRRGDLVVHTARATSY